MNRNQHHHHHHHNHNHQRPGEKPYGTRLDNHDHTHEQDEGEEGDDWRPLRPRQPTTIWDMGPYKKMQYQQFRRPSTTIQTPREEDVVIQDEGEVDDLATPGDGVEYDDEEEMPKGSRGGIQGSLAAIDRRPGRPSFHHMGPTSVPSRFRQQQQQQHRRRMMLQNRYPNYNFQRRMGQPAATTLNPVKEAKRMLRKFGDFIALAESEAVMLRDIVRNITESGRELNLREMLRAVNATVHDNPDSAMATLMRRFYSKYLITRDDEAVETNSAAADPAAIYEKSLSSMLFLAFGIFLLNSVNEIAAAQARSFDRIDDDDAKAELEAFRAILDNHPELSELFNADDAKELTPVQSEGVNGFLKLLMNLDNAYKTSDENPSELSCIWSLYCHQLNRQAEMGGMMSTVARINSVGMRVLMRDLRPDYALRAIAAAMINWKDLECRAYFPDCDDGRNELLPDEQTENPDE